MKVWKRPEKNKSSKRLKTGADRKQGRQEERNGNEGDAPGALRLHVCPPQVQPGGATAEMKKALAEP